MATLGDLAKLVRSKNAGPFWLTIDIMFDDAEAYRRARDTEIVKRAAIARLYSRKPADIIVVNHDTALAIKVSFPVAKVPAPRKTATFMAGSNMRHCWGCECQIDSLCDSAFPGGISRCEFGQRPFKKLRRYDSRHKQGASHSIDRRR